MEKGLCTISIDFEFAWGYADSKLSGKDLERIRGEVAITRRLLQLFEQYNIAATWAIVGHLLTPHKKYGEDVAWYDSHNLIDAIRTSPARHEIGSHSYEHVLYGKITEDAAARDARAAADVHSARGLPFASFVFPRNSEGHHDVLKEAGISCFRTTTKRWYSVLPGPLRRLGHYLDYFFSYVPTELPRKHASGLVAIPDSMLLLGRNGIRRIIPPEQMVKRAKKGLNKAVKKNELFHLWFHPSNFSYDTETQFEIFEEILKHAVTLREAGKLEMVTMGTLAQKYGA